jgi:putative holliday junction resolvase
LLEIFKMNRVLALDIGSKRIGVAISDALNMTAQGLETLKRESDELVFDRIRALVNEYNISKIVVGIPFNMNGSKGAGAISVEGFIEEMKKKVPAEVETIDERLTTVQGERALLEGGVSRRKRKMSIDRIAAQLILQSYLEMKCTKK